VWPSTALRRRGSSSSAKWPFLHHHDERCAGSDAALWATFIDVIIMFK
jgi:hypothetical protein